MWKTTVTLTIMRKNVLLWKTFMIRIGTRSDARFHDDDDNENGLHMCGAFMS